MRKCIRDGFEIIPFTETVRVACQTKVYYVLKHCKQMGGYKCARVASDGLAVGLSVKQMNFHCVTNIAYFRKILIE
jgi:hypothetical protein